MYETEQSLTQEQITRMFLNEGRSRFDILEYVFNKQELLQRKPIILISLIYEKLTLKKGSFNEGSFRVWLRRYRKNNVVESNANRLAQSTVNPVPEQKATEAPPKERIEVAPFKFTDPSTLKKGKEPLFHVVKPEDYK